MYDIMVLPESIDYSELPPWGECGILCLSINCVSIYYVYYTLYHCIMLCISETGVLIFIAILYVYLKLQDHFRTFVKYLFRKLFISILLYIKISVKDMK